MIETGTTPRASDGHASRRLAAVVSADVVGYGRLVERDEERTVARLKAHFESLIRPEVEAHGGRVVKLMGDGALIEFPSAVEAARCSLVIQAAIIAGEADVPEAERVSYRIGIHLGDVIIDGEDIQGDGVNIASRIEGLAEPGGICITRAVRDEVEGRLNVTVEDRGEHHLKNIARPVWVFNLKPAGDSHRRILMPPRRAHRRLVVSIAILAVTIFAAGFALWWSTWRTSDLEEQVVVGEPVSQEPSILVLPFLNLSDDARQDYFVDGMTEDLITDLSKLSGLLVISRNTAFSYRGQAIPVSRIATELGVRYVVEGSVRRDGDRIRVSVQLIDAQIDHHLWAERFDRDLTDVFAVQDDIKEEIIGALSVKLGAAEDAVLSGRPTDSIEAYEYYLRGRRAMYQGDLRSLRLAYWTFEKAIELDPDFAEAYASLANVYAIDYAGALSPFDWTRPPMRARAAAESLARRAQAITPALATAELALARLRLAELRFEDALSHAEQTISLAPGHSDGHMIKALVLTTLGRHQEALMAIEKALRRNPKAPPDHFVTLGMAQFALHDYPSALNSFERAADATPVSLHWQALALYAATQGRMGMQLPKLGWLQPSVSEVLTFPIYDDEVDQEHLIDGLRLSGAPEVPFGYSLSDHASTQIRGDDLPQLLTERTLDAFCPLVEQTATLRVSGNGSAHLQLRHDISESGDATISNDTLCMRFPVISRGRDLCFKVFPNDPPGAYSKGLDYAIVGPILCYFTARN